MSGAIILDFDGSVTPLPGAQVVALRDRQEEIRFACPLGTLRALGGLVPPASIAFLGSGDYHHVSYLLIERLRRSLQVVVFDNHPDNMRYPFGIHCASWVGHVSRLPFVSRVHVVGIASADVEGIHVIENRLAPLRAAKVIYWCVGRDLRWLRAAGVRASKSFASTAEMLATFSEALRASDEPIYLSIDKDVLAADVVRTNWDQGVMTLDELTAAIASFRPRVIASDITGDASAYRFRSLFKRALIAIERGRSRSPFHSQHEVNRRLLALLSAP